MATKVILDGVMGRRFGKHWELFVNSPSEALRMINANRPGLFIWIRDNLEAYQNYRVTCSYSNGVVADIDEHDLNIHGEIDTIRFTAIPTGSGNTLKVIAGVVVMVAGAVTGNAAIFMMGAGVLLSGIVGMLSPQPKMSDMSNRVDKTSRYFNGPVNTAMNGVPVSLIYGRCKVGSHPISVAYTADEDIQ
jgi:predicted phage tail protein